MNKILDLTPEGSGSASIDETALFDVLSFDYIKEPPTLDIPDTWTDIISISKNKVAGVYVLAMSMTWTYDRTNKSAFFRFSTDGETTWHEFVAEPKDKTDSNSFYYSFPIDHSLDGIIQVKVEGKKEATGGQMDINFADLWIERKG